MAFDVAGARSEGYSDRKIVYLPDNVKFDVSGA